MAKQTIDDLAVEGKRILVRVDFNVPLDPSGAITDDTRIRAALPTITELLRCGAAVILMSHLGRPKGKPDPRYSLAPVAARLSELLSIPVTLAPDCGGGQFPGASVNPNPLYQVPLSAFGSHCLAGAGVGNAQAALELTIEAIRERSTSYTAAPMRDLQAVQLRVAAAGAKVDAARLIIRADCQEGQRMAKDNRVPTIEEKLRVKRNVAYAMELCNEAVDTLHALAGANGIYDRYPIQRLFRDQHALTGHIGFSWDAQGAPWGLVALGGEVSSPTL